jgi:hypothetical protein
MRLLQFAGLVATVAGVYLAQYIVAHAGVANSIPSPLLDLFPSLSRLNRWLPEDLYTLAAWVMTLSALGFGLLSPIWQPGRGVRMWRFSVTQIRSSRPIAALACASVAAVIGVALVIRGDRVLPAEGVLWLISLALLMVSAVLLDQMRSSHISYTQEGRPERGWPVAALILAAGVFLMIWSSDRLPAQIPEQTARLALQAFAQVGGEQSLFAYGDANQPGFASLPLAAFLFAGFRPLDAIRWGGVMAGVTALIASWLLACELFRRSGDPAPDDADAYDLPVDDDGRTPALWSLLVLAGAVPMIHFGRLSGQLESVACGVLGLWLLLRAVRLARLTLVAASGVLIGASLMLSTSGVAFVVTAALLWVGLWLLRRSWLEFHRGGIGGAGAALWIASLLLACSPLLGGWIREPDRLMTLQPNFLDRLQSTALAFGAQFDASPFANVNLPMLSSLIAPLFALGVGALLFRLDHLIGWTLVLWMVCVVIIAAIAVPHAPWWPLLLPALPAAALAIGFALDRIRAMIGYTLGGWTTQVVSYLAVGLLLLAGVTSWVEYAQASTARRDLTTALARSIEQAPADAPIYWVASEGSEPTSWSDPLLLTVGKGRSQTGVMLNVEEMAAWPGDLPPLTSS